MASLLLRPLLRPQLFAAAPFGLGLSLYTYHHLTSRSRAYKLDGFGAASLGGGGGATGTYSYSKDARTPVVTKSDGGKWKLNPRAVRQVSFGSITGLCAGLLVSTFSKSLALLLGLMVVGVQWASSYGIHVIPYSRLQKYVNGIDLRSAMQDNVAAKVSFGVTFAMAGFMSF